MKIISFKDVSYHLAIYAMYKVKNAFTAWMISPSELHFTNAVKEPTSADIFAVCIF